MVAVQIAAEKGLTIVCAPDQISRIKRVARALGYSDGTPDILSYSRVKDTAYRQGRRMFVMDIERFVQWQLDNRMNGYSIYCDLDEKNEGVLP